jgi:hypothetical protein
MRESYRRDGSKRRTTVDSGDVAQPDWQPPRPTESSTLRDAGCRRCPSIVGAGVVTHIGMSVDPNVWAVAADRLAPAPA